ncbi:TPA: GGDEF domain-containing protein [Serratia odorifera]|nr:GGDEF domain-containing protein [Serratia odorifera]
MRTLPTANAAKRPLLLRWLLHSPLHADDCRFQSQMRQALPMSVNALWLYVVGAVLLSTLAVLAVLSGRYVLMSGAGLLLCGLAFWLIQYHAAAPRLAMLEITLLTTPYLLATPFSGVQNLYLLADILPLWLWLAHGLIRRHHRQLAQSVKLAAEQQRAAHRDPLTGLLNRTGVEAILAEVCQPSPIAHSLSHMFILEFGPLSALYQSHGVQIGDDVLRTLGERLKTLIRPSDHLCHYLGGQFLILLHDLPYSAENELLARITPPLAAPFDFGAFGSVSLSLTTGILILRPRHDQTVDGLLTAAQQVLAEAKRGGK